MSKKHFCVLAFDSTVTPSGVITIETINKPKGSINMPLGALTTTVNNSLVTVDSLVICVIQTTGLTSGINSVVPANGSFTVNLNIALIAAAKISFIVFN